MHPAERIFSQHPGLETKLGGRQLTPRDLRFVVRTVHDVADKWEGIALCLRVKDIDKIKKDYRGAGKRMIAVLSAWLRRQTLDNEPPSWKKVVWVVADRVGGDNPAHAERILLNYDSFSQYTPSAMAAEADSSPFVQRGVSKGDIESKATDLQKELDEVEHRWYQLGVLLGLPVHTLDGYQENYDDLRDRLRAMLQEWLQKGYTEEYEVPSWQVLVDAVEHSAGGENPRLAAELATKRVVGTPDTATGSTSSSTGATVPPVQSSFQQPTGVLTAKDLGNLTTIMKPAVPKWKTIGDTLGFLDSDLNIIQSSPMLIPEAPASYFREMLSQWLKWAPPNHPWPTLEALETALRSSGHEDLALNLKSLFLKKK